MDLDNFFNKENVEIRLPRNLDGKVDTANSKYRKKEKKIINVKYRDKV